VREITLRSADAAIRETVQRCGRETGQGGFNSYYSSRAIVQEKSAFSMSSLFPHRTVTLILDQQHEMRTRPNEGFGVHDTARWEV
jgi:hypothetical protein